MKAKGHFISALLVVDAFLIAFAYGFNSRTVQVVDSSLPPVKPKTVNSVPTKPAPKGATPGKPKKPVASPKTTPKTITSKNHKKPIASPKTITPARSQKSKVESH